MKAVIVSGGNAPSLKLLKEELAYSSLLICADSGGDCLFQYKILPQYLIGDFDSISPAALDYFMDTECIVEKYPVNKDFTDTVLALNKAIELGATEIVFLGCTGTRLDHTLGNIGLLQNCISHGISGSILDEHNRIQLINKRTKFHGRKGETFSLLAYNQTVKHLTIENCKYPLSKYTLHIGDPLTLSNEFIEGDVTIDFDNDSSLLIFFSKD